ncbi:hypothetical protein BN873_p10013 [Candidatus Competibacter denitrificans Run_A_D11]|uniref:Uncharacterized protein n=1 Tax=Candidatus Competibacter denitrificans Run_A_D11 TaxID=1400863 RepID=W6MBX8_9GAMM|nr:hypothetical protein [Candidatus Competibacter denitrificans]CDI04569.1 hypothetical protein BN873_p10013 [Candidatus Competibacter denitrificans Run_A_D11]
MSSETRLALDGYLLLDPQTQRIRFTRTGQAALASRFARVGVDIRRLRTLEEVEDAMSSVSMREYRRLPPDQKDDDDANNAIDDLHFITDGVRGRRLMPLEERRQRMAEGMDKLLALIGVTV